MIAVGPRPDNAAIPGAAARSAPRVGRIRPSASREQGFAGYGRPATGVRVVVAA